MPSGGGRHRLRRLLLGALAVAVVVALYATGLTFYFAAQHRASAIVFKNENSPPDHLAALARTITFDPNKGDMVVRVEVRPSGNLAAADGVSVNRPVSIDVVGGTGKASYRYNAGDRIAPVDVTIGLNGDVNSYPYDSYQSGFAMDATAGPAPDAAQQGAAPAVAPTVLEFDGALSGYRVKTASLPTNPEDVNVLALDLTVKRASVTVAFAILMLVLQGLLALAAAMLAIFIIRRHRRVEIPMLTWLAALLFAIVPLRNAMPTAPPIGAEVDVIVFFWAVTVITVSLLSILITWLRQPPAPP